MASKFPDPCPQCSPHGGNFRVVDRPNGITATERCSCARGKWLDRADRNRNNPPINSDQPFKSKINVKAARQAAVVLKDIPDFPREAENLTMVANTLMSLCRSNEQLTWIVNRMIALYSKWPGMREMRIVFCSRFLPADGYELRAGSSFYPEGIPSETPDIAIVPPMLPAGRVASADLEFDQAIRKIASEKALPPAKQTKVGDQEWPDQREYGTR